MRQTLVFNAPTTQLFNDPGNEPNPACCRGNYLCDRCTELLHQRQAREVRTTRNDDHDPKAALDVPSVQFDSPLNRRPSSQERPVTNIVPREPPLRWDTGIFYDPFGTQPGS